MHAATCSRRGRSKYYTNEKQLKRDKRVFLFEK